MDLRELRDEWSRLGERDPMWAVLTLPGMEGGRWDADAFYATGREEIDALLRDLDELRPKLPRHRALDFGCGAGRLTQALASHFELVDGVDIAPTMVDFARRHNRQGERCRFTLNDRDDLALFPDAAFDLVYSNMVLQHMEPRYAKGYVSEFVRLLRPDGLAVFQVPASRTPRDRWKDLVPRPLRSAYVDLAYRRRGRPVMEMHAIPRREVEAHVAQAGGRVLDVRQRRASKAWVNLFYVAERAGRRRSI